jgi:hypothetical protein
MLPLGLVGINMADSASDKLGEGFWNYLVALGFILPLVGVEELIRWEVTASEHVLPWWISAILVAVGYPLYESKALWKLSWGVKKGAIEPLQYLHHEDTELGPAIMMMAWDSAWGKWYAAQCLANSPKGTPNNREENVISTAASSVWDGLKDGKLVAHGRKPGQLDYEPIPQTHWRSSPLHMVRDNATLWKMVLIPTGGAEIHPDGTIVGRDQPSVQRTSELQTYDSLIVNARQFEGLWPKKEKRADTARRVFLRKAKKNGADPVEIATLLRDASQGWMRRYALPLLPLVLVLAVVYLLGPEIYRRSTKPVAVSGAIGEMPIGTTEPKKPLLPEGTISGLQAANELKELRSQVDELKRERDAALATKHPAGPNSGPIIWNSPEAEQLFVVGMDVSGYQVSGALFWGKSTESISITEAYAVSGLTGHKQELKANVAQKGYFPVNKVDIPPGAPVHLDLVWNPAIPLKDFISQWGKFRVVIVYNGVRYERDYDEALVRQKLQQQAPDMFGPQMTPRDDK